MNGMKRAALGVSVGLVVTCGLGGCDLGAHGQANQSAQVKHSAVSSKSGEAVATVNGEPITRSRLQAYRRSHVVKGRQLSPRQALDQLVDIELLRQEAHARGIDKRTNVREQLALQRDSLLSTVLLREAADTPKITDADLRHQYALAVAAMPSKAYHLQQIMVGSREDARRVEAELRKGAVFADLARKMSKGPNAAKGGDLGWVASKALLPIVADKVGKLKAGEVSAPVQTASGWHVLRLDGERKLKKPAFASVLPALKARVVRQRARAFVHGLRQTARIRMNLAAK